MGAGTRLPVGRVHVLACRCGRALGGVAVGAGARLPVEEVGVSIRFPGSPDTLAWVRQQPE